MPDQVQRFDAPKVGRRAWAEPMAPCSTGVYVYHSDYEKAERGRAYCEVEMKRARDRAGEAEAERDQAIKQRDEELRERALKLDIGWQPGAEPADYLRRADVLSLFEEADDALDRQAGGVASELEEPPPFDQWPFDDDPPDPL